MYLNLTYIKIFLLITTFSTLCDSLTSSLNVLMVIKFFAKSHYFVFESIAKELSSKGHNVTVIVNFQIPQSDQYRVISIAEEQTNAQNKTEIMNVNMFSGSRMDMYKRPVAQAQYSNSECERLGSKKLQDFIKENNTFDVIVAEVFNTNCFYGLAKIYDAPILGK